jgi:hypothetical protein
MLVLIFGKTRSGKTYLTKEKFIPDNNFIIYDVNNEYEDVTDLDLIDNVEDFEDSIDNLDLPIRCDFETDEEIDQSFEILKKIKNCTIIIDEFHQFVSKYDKKKKIFPLVRKQFHKGLNFVCISQRISDIHTSIFSQAHIIITFKQTELRDLDILEKYGFNPEAVKNLGEYKYIIKQT